MKMKKKRKPLFFAAIAVVSLVAIVGLSLLTLTIYVRSDDYGFNKMSQKTNPDGTSTIYIKCTEFYGYSVEPVDLDEKVYKGEQLSSLNDDLGNYVVKVELHDADPSNHFSEKYSPWTTYKIDNSELSFMYTEIDTHGTAIYIGSDVPIDMNVVVKGFNFRTDRFENCFLWLF